MWLGFSIRKRKCYFCKFINLHCSIFVRANKIFVYTTIVDLRVVLLLHPRRFVIRR